MFATVSNSVKVSSLLSLAGSMGCRIKAKPFRLGSRPAVTLTSAKDSAPVFEFATEHDYFDFCLCDDPNADAPKTPEQIEAYGREYELSEQASGACKLSSILSA